MGGPIGYRRRRLGSEPKFGRVFPTPLYERKLKWRGIFSCSNSSADCFLPTVSLISFRGFAATAFSHPLPRRPGSANPRPSATPFGDLQILWQPLCFSGSSDREVLTQELDGCWWAWASWLPQSGYPSISAGCAPRPVRARLVQNAPSLALAWFCRIIFPDYA